jgi:hypothetical protein
MDIGTVSSYLCVHFPLKIRTSHIIAVSGEPAFNLATRLRM